MSGVLRIAAAAVAIRMVLIACLIVVADKPLDVIADARDGVGYQEYAGAIATGDFDGLSVYNRRLFPGYPFLIALLALTGIDTGIAAIALNIAGAAAAAALSAKIFDDERVGWAMAVLTPSHVLYTTVAMSEGVMIFGGTLAVWLALRFRPASSGLALGASAIVRPFVVSVAAGLAVLFVRRPRTVVVIAATSLFVVVLGLVAMEQWSGEWMPGGRVYESDARAYPDGIFTWPFRSLIETPAAIGAPAWKVAYIWLHVLIVLAGCVLALRLALDSAAVDQNRLAAGWLIANTAVIVCIGGIWGFAEFHRFVIPALPPLFYVFRRWIPRGWMLLPVAAASGWMAYVAAARPW